MKTALLAVWLLLIPVSTIAGSENNEARLSSEELKAKARIVSADQTEVETLAVELFVPGLQHLYMAFYRKPEDFALMVCDAVDLTPLYVVVAKTCLIYDPTKDSLLILKDLGVCFELAMVQGELRFVAKGDSTYLDHQVVRVDLPSILEQVQYGLESAELPQGGYVLSGQTAAGSTFRGEVDPDAAIPMNRFELTSPVEDTPAIVVRRISVNTALDSSVFTLPEGALQAFGLCIEMTTLNVESFSGVMASQYRSFLTREAIRNPKQRPDLRKLGIQALDWEEVISRDERVAPLLRKAFRIGEFVPTP